MTGFSTTVPDRASPFADTDPRPSHSQVMAVLERARKRLAAVPRPRLYWEEPGLHGHKREVNLRRPAMRPAVKRRTEASYSTGKLPARPQRFELTPGHVLIAAGVVGVAALGVWLWKRGRAQPPHLGDAFDGLDLLGCEQ